MGEGFDLMKLIREAEKLQEKVSSRQDELAAKHYEAETGGGMVRATVNGVLEVVSIQVEKEALDNLGLASTIELVTAAVNEAIKRARESAKGDIMGLFQDMAGGLLPKEPKP
jgi:hypothetical protein